MSFDPAPYRRLLNQISPFSDPDFAKAFRKQISPLSDPETVKALRRQISPLSDPETVKALRTQISPLSDPETARTLRRQISPLSDPEIAKALRKQISPLSDPETVRQLRDLLSSTSTLSTADRETAVAAVAVSADQFDATVGEVATDVLETSDATAADDFAWVDLLPTAQQLRLLNSTMELLTAVLALLGLLSGLAVPVVLAAAAEVLVRLASVLLDRIEKAQP